MVILGHIISAECDDKAYVINRHNAIFGLINNVLCYFGECQSLVKHKLLFAYCYNVQYGSVLEDLKSCYVESVCTTWHKGLHVAT